MAPLIEGRTWLELLSVDDCLALLAAETLGRLGVIVGGHPEIFPVNFAVDDGHVVFRVDEGTKLSAIDAGNPVAFEADGHGEQPGEGWSVLVVGTAADVVDAARVRHFEELAVVPWAHGEKTHWVELVPDKVTGRRIVALDPEA